MVKYTFEYLQQLLDQNNAKCNTKEIKQKYPKLTRETIVNFECRCGRKVEKTFGRIKILGALCIGCIAEKNGKKIEVYDIEFLEKTLKKYNATCDMDELVKQYKKISQLTLIKFKCSCGTLHEKKFIWLNQCGAYCPNCMINHKTEERKKSCLEIYGCENPIQNEKVKEKLKKTCLEKYGCENPMQNQEVHKKAEGTCLEKYGCKNPMQNQEVHKKAEETCFHNYGVNNPSQSNIIEERKKKTSLKNYGFEYPLQNIMMQNKLKETCLARYGVEYATQNPEFRKKSEETCMRHYGVRFPLQNSEVMKKLEKTCQERYGFSHSSQNADVQDKAIKTCLDHYGVEYSLQDVGVRTKSKQTCIERYGVPYPLWNRDIFTKVVLSGYKWKEYIFPSGQVKKYQGYENLALNELLLTIKENYIITSLEKEMPIINYVDFNEKPRQYHPDILILYKKLFENSTTNIKDKIIEVKSYWTFTSSIENNIAKKIACLSSGYDFEFWIYESRTSTTHISDIDLLNKILYNNEKVLH
jgi:hypothetical protein